MAAYHTRTECGNGNANAIVNGIGIGKGNGTGDGNGIEKLCLHPEESRVKQYISAEISWCNIFQKFYLGIDFLSPSN